MLSLGQARMASHLGSSSFSTTTLRGRGRKTAIAFRALQQRAVLGCFQVPVGCVVRKALLAPAAFVRRSRAGIACTRSACLLYPQDSCQSCCVAETFRKVPRHGPMSSANHRAAFDQRMRWDSAAKPIDGPRPTGRDTMGSPGKAGVRPSCAKIPLGQKAGAAPSRPTRHERPSNVPSGCLTATMKTLAPGLRSVRSPNS